MRRIFLTSAIVTMLLLGACASPPEMILLFDVQPVPIDTTTLIVWLCLNDKPANEGALKIASNFNHFAIDITSAQAPSGTLGVEADAISANGTSISVGLVDLTVPSGTTSLPVPILLIS